MPLTPHDVEKVRELLKEHEERSRYKLASLKVDRGETIIVPEGMILYYSEVFIEGELVIEGDLKVV